MSKTSSKKHPNTNSKPVLAALAVTKKRHSLGKPHRKTRKNVRSHQQTIQARDTLNAEYHDWRTGTTSVMDLPLRPPDGSTTTTTTTTPMTGSQTAGLGSPSVQVSEKSVQDLVGVLSAL